jgi:putative tricarboxylic transport membrane protein
LTRLGWTDAYLARADFERFLDEERVRVGRIVARLRASGGDTALTQAGDSVFPLVVIGASALVLLQLIVRCGARIGGRKANRSALARLVLGLVLFIPLMSVAGFVAAGTVLFVCTASAFGSRRWRRDALVGLTVCAAVYTTFTLVLGVPLP